MLCLLLWLTASCAKPLVRTETVEVQVPVVVALDPALTTPAPEPALPRRACTDPANGKATLCNGTLPDYVDALRAWGRGLEAQLAAILALQPDPPPTR